MGIFFEWVGIATCFIVAGTALLILVEAFLFAIIMTYMTRRAYKFPKYRSIPYMIFSLMKSRLFGHHETCTEVEIDGLIYTPPLRLTKKKPPSGYIDE